MLLQYLGRYEGYMKGYFSRIECILKEVEIASCTDMFIVFASIGEILSVSSNKSCKETFDGDRAKIREQLREGDGLYMDRRERWITLSRALD